MVEPENKAILISYSSDTYISRPLDIGKSKAQVAAEFVNKRVPGCCVIPYPINSAACIIYFLY